MRCTWILVLIISASVSAENLPREQPVGKLEVVATFNGAMPTGVTVSQKGRMFVNFPKWGDDVKYTVAELRDGKAVAYPSEEMNKAAGDAADYLVSAQSVVVDPQDRLWILDTGSIEFGPVKPGGAKLVGVDLSNDKVFKKIVFPDNVALPTTYLNDIRFDLRRGNGGMAYITDSSKNGPNGIIVVDLESGKAWRRLHDHPSTKPDKNFLPWVEGRPLMMNDGRQKAHLSLGSDGIAISHDGKRLFYTPLSSRDLYSVSVDALSDAKMSDDDVGKTVEALGNRGFASDGLESDAQGRLYLTDYEHNAIQRRNENGEYETIAHDPVMLWPDTMSLASDGFLYFTVNQLHRQKNYQGGKDLRDKPYALLRVRVDGRPVMLNKGRDETSARE